MSARARARVAAAAAVLLTAAITGATALLPTDAHAAVREDRGATVQTAGSGGDTAALATGAVVFTGTGVALAFGISRRGRHHQS
jgi:hypothetical protein